MFGEVGKCDGGLIWDAVVSAQVFSRKRCSDALGQRPDLSVGVRRTSSHHRSAVLPSARTHLHVFNDGMTYLKDLNVALRTTARAEHVAFPLIDPFPALNDLYNIVHFHPCQSEIMLWGIAYHLTSSADGGGCEHCVKGIWVFWGICLLSLPFLSDDGQGIGHESRKVILEDLSSVPNS